MSEIFSLDGINYAKEVVDPFPIGGSTVKKSRIPLCGMVF